MGLSLESVHFKCGTLTFECSIVYQAKGFFARIKYPPSASAPLHPGRAMSSKPACISLPQPQAISGHIHVLS